MGRPMARLAMSKHVFLLILKYKDKEEWLYALSEPALSIPVCLRLGFPMYRSAK